MNKSNTTVCKKPAGPDRGRTGQPRQQSATAESVRPYGPEEKSSNLDTKHAGKIVGHVTLKATVTIPIDPATGHTGIELYSVKMDVPFAATLVKTLMSTNKE